MKVLFQIRAYYLLHVLQWTPWNEDTYIIRTPFLSQEFYPAHTCLDFVSRFEGLDYFQKVRCTLAVNAELRLGSQYVTLPRRAVPHRVVSCCAEDRTTPHCFTVSNIINCTSLSGSRGVSVRTYTGSISSLESLRSHSTYPDSPNFYSVYPSYTSHTYNRWGLVHKVDQVFFTLTIKMKGALVQMCKKTVAVGFWWYYCICICSMQLQTPQMNYRVWQDLV